MIIKLTNKIWRWEVTTDLQCTSVRRLGRLNLSTSNLPQTKNFSPQKESGPYFSLSRPNCPRRQGWFLWYVEISRRVHSPQTESNFEFWRAFEGALLFYNAAMIINGLLHGWVFKTLSTETYLTSIHCLHFRSQIRHRWSTGSHFLQEGNTSLA